MAKKTAADLDMTALAIAERHAAACSARLDDIWKDIDKMFGKSGDDLRKGVTMAMFDEKMAEHAKAVNELFHATDTLLYQQRHADDPPTEPLVPPEDVRAMLTVILEDKTDELLFSVNRGLLANAVGNAIRMDVDEVESGSEPPLCQDCV